MTTLKTSKTTNVVNPSFDDVTATAATRGRPKGKGTATKQFGQVAYMVRNARLKLGLSQAQVGTRTGYSAQFINNIEHGRAPVPAKALALFSIALELNRTRLVNAAVSQKVMHILGAKNL